MVIPANQHALFRFLDNDNNWRKWWPGAGDRHTAAGLKTGNYWFKKKFTGFNSFDIAINGDNMSQNSSLNLVMKGHDSVNLAWTTTLEPASNPFDKIRKYFVQAGKIRHCIRDLLSALASHAGQVKNLYGFDIRPGKVNMEYMVSVRQSIPHYPETPEIYRLIDTINQFIQTKKGTVEHPPIMNISRAANGSYDLLVAIPVKEQIIGSGMFQSKKMLRNGNLLVTEVFGGREIIDSALHQIDRYALDHQYRNIALPFRSFLTDRRLESDSSKWRTLIGYPIL